MTSSRRARRRRRQARQWRLARRQAATGTLRLRHRDSWLAGLQVIQESMDALVPALKQVSWALTYVTTTFGKAAMSFSRSEFSARDQDALALGSVTGVRYWSLSNAGAVNGMFRAADGSPAIQLQGAQASWEPGENHAVCLRGGTHAVPHAGCGCGFWAYWAPDPGGGWAYISQPHVAGIIEGWGRYRAGTRGFRCAKAKILALCVQDELPGEEWRVAAEQALAAKYQVPVYSTVNTMLKAFPPTRQEARGSDNHPAFARGGYVPPHMPQATIGCPCGTVTHMGAPGFFACMCGQKWQWDGITQPMAMITPRAAMKQLGIGETGSS